MSLALAQTAPREWIGAPPPVHQPAAPANGFALLLARLHPDPEEAGREYERLRTRLVRFFDWRGAAQPDDCADTTLDRLVLKLQATDVVDVQKYVYGIARLVLLEQQRRPTWTSLDDAPVALAAPVPESTDTTLEDAFERCLDTLPDESRTLLLQYYAGEGRTRIENRRQLAATLGVTDNALRSRAQRLRDLLERSVLARVATAGRSRR